MSKKVEKKEDKQVVSNNLRDMVFLLRKLHGLFGKYYLDAFQKEETIMSPVCSLADLRRSSIKMHYLHFYNDLLYWCQFLEVKSMMRNK